MGITKKLIRTPMKTHGRTRPPVMNKTREMVPHDGRFTERVKYISNTVMVAQINTAQKGLAGFCKGFYNN